MCDCTTCGAFYACDNPGCTNDECPECRDLREEMEDAAAVDDPQPETETMTADGQGRR